MEESTDQVRREVAWLGGIVGRTCRPSVLLASSLYVCGRNGSRTICEQGTPDLARVNVARAHLEAVIRTITARRKRPHLEERKRNRLHGPCKSGSINRICDGMLHTPPVPSSCSCEKPVAEKAGFASYPACCPLLVPERVRVRILLRRQRGLVCLMQRLRVQGRSSGAAC